MGRFKRMAENLKMEDQPTIGDPSKRPPRKMAGAMNNTGVNINNNNEV